MKTGKSIFKAGKLLRIFLEFDDSIGKVKITGDFFIHPEDAILELEKSLEGTPLSEEAIKGKADSFLSRKDVQVYGFDAGQLAQAILLATK